MKKFNAEIPTPDGFATVRVYSAAEVDLLLNKILVELRFINAVVEHRIELDALIPEIESIVKG
jgi:hypothetical protein